MTTLFPAALDNLTTLTDPAGTDPLDAGLTHAILHDDTTDAIEAMEKVIVGPILYNVKAYQVKGDNTTDDRANLAAADAACAAAGNVLYFPPSAGYKVSSALTLASNCIFAMGASINPDTGITVTFTGRLQLPFAQCFGGAGSIVLASNSVPSCIPQWWGAKGDNSNSTDDTAPVKSAITAASAAILTVQLASIYHVTQQITAASVDFIGFGPSKSGLRWSTGLGAGVPGVISSGDRDHCHMTMIGLFGPGPGTPVLGVKGATMDGLRVDGKLLTQACRITQFDANVTINNGPSGGQTGHYTDMNSTFNSGYYGAFIKSDGGDTQLIGTDLTGQGMASIGITGLILTGEGFMQGWNCFHVHCGFAPFGIFQEAGTTGSFMKDNNLLSMKFEQCGNAAIYTSNASAGYENNTITHSGFAWNSSKYLNTYPQDYACVIGNVAQSNSYTPRINPFTAGKRAVWYINNLNGGFEMNISANEAMNIAAGNKQYLQIKWKNLALKGAGQIAASTTSVVISTVGSYTTGIYLGDVASLFPQATINQTSVAGVTNPALGVSAISSSCVAPVSSGPTATVGGAGNVNAGTHQYYVVHRSNLGGTNVGHTDSGPGSAVINPGVASQVTLTNIPQGGSDVSAIEIYRTAAGNAGNPLLLVSLAPGTTSYTDNIADASLGAAVVHSDTATGTQFTVSVLSGTPTGAVNFLWAA